MTTEITLDSFLTGSLKKQGLEIRSLPLFLSFKTLPGDALFPETFDLAVNFYDKENHQAIADLLALRDEVIPADEYVLFDPQAPWKQKRIKDYEMRELQEQIFDHGKLVYTVPSTEEVKNYCMQQMDTLWEEVKRLRYPHRYYVDYSRQLYDLKQELIEKNTIKI